LKPTISNSEANDLKISSSGSSIGALQLSSGTRCIGSVGVTTTSLLESVNGSDSTRAGRRVGRELLARRRAPSRCMMGPSADILVKVAAVVVAGNDRRRGDRPEIEIA
jgi:hypothetical protein